MGLLSDLVEGGALLGGLQVGKGTLPASVGADDRNHQKLRGEVSREDGVNYQRNKLAMGQNFQSRHSADMQAERNIVWGDGNKEI